MRKQVHLVRLDFYGRGVRLFPDETTLEVRSIDDMVKHVMLWKLKDEIADKAAVKRGVRTICRGTDSD